MTGQWKGHENPYLLTLVGPRTGRCWVQKPGQLVFTEHLLTSPPPPAGGRSYSPDFIHVETENQRGGVPCRRSHSLKTAGPNWDSVRPGSPGHSQVLSPHLTETPTLQKTGS